MFGYIFGEIISFFCRFIAKLCKMPTKVFLLVMGRNSGRYPPARRIDFGPTRM